MISEQVARQSFARHDAFRKDTPTLGQELRNVFRFVFAPPKERLKATDFVWTHLELADDMPD